MRTYKICCDLCGKEITNEKQYKYPILNTMACMEDGTIEIDQKICVRIVCLTYQ